MALYISSSSGGRVNGVGFSDEDIMIHDLASDTWAKYFDGSDVSGGTDVAAFALLADGSILLSYNTPVRLPGLGRIDDSDIVRFIPDSMGNRTAGSFEHYFDGSDVGLTSSSEDIDGLAVLANGDLLISTLGSARVPGISGRLRDEDVMRFTPNVLGGATSGNWSLHLDGSNVDLHNNSREDVWGVWHDGESSKVYLTTRGTFAVPGLNGEGSDIFICTPDAGGTDCAFSLFWSGADHGMGNERLDGIHIAEMPTTFSIINESTIVEEESIDSQEQDADDDTGDDSGEVIFLPLLSK